MVEAIWHYNNVMMSVIVRLKSPASWVFTQPFIQGADQRNTIAPRHWSLWGEFTGDRRIPRTKGQ